MKAPPLRRDLQIIADMIAPETRVLDVGCGDGALLDYLVHEKNIDGRGIEISQTGVNACVTHGLSVIQGDADTDLADYPADAFDYVVLSETLQATHNPREVLLQLVRIGRNAVVSFTNFGHWRIRWRLLCNGRVPAVDAGQTGIVMGAANGKLPVGGHWYDTPNIHICTIRDFSELCTEIDLSVERAVSLNRNGKSREIGRINTSANLRSEQGIFLLTRT